MAVGQREVAALMQMVRGRQRRRNAEISHTCPACGTTSAADSAYMPGVRSRCLPALSPPWGHHGARTRHQSSRLHGADPPVGGSRAPVRIRQLCVDRLSRVVGRRHEDPAAIQGRDAQRGSGAAAALPAAATAKIAVAIATVATAAIAAVAAAAACSSLGAARAAPHGWDGEEQAAVLRVEVGLLGHDRRVVDRDHRGAVAPARRAGNAANADLSRGRGGKWCR